MRTRSGTTYVSDAPTILPEHLPDVMRTRPCPHCDHPRDPLSHERYKTAQQQWSFHYATAAHWQYCRDHYLDPDYDGYCHTHVQQASQYTWVCLDCRIIWWEPRFNIHGVPNSYDAAKLWSIFQPDVKSPTTRSLRAYVQRWKCSFSAPGYVLPSALFEQQADGSIGIQRRADQHDLLPDVDRLIDWREHRIRTAYREWSPISGDSLG